MERVTTFEARRAQQQLAERWGEPAPGPTELLLPPDPEVVAGAEVLITESTYGDRRHDPIEKMDEDLAEANRYERKFVASRSMRDVEASTDLMVMTRKGAAAVVADEEEGK